MIARTDRSCAEGAKRVAVIGAGLAGLAAARALREANAAVTVFEKSRGLGGRLATRRTDAFAFDHGAQFVTGNGPGGVFDTFLDQAIAAGCAAGWPDGGVDGTGIGANGAANPVVGLPGMSALVRPLAEGLPIARQAEVAALARTSGRWQLTVAGDGDGANGHAGFDSLVLAVPAPQAARLLATADVEVDGLGEVGMAPAFALMAAFDHGAVPDAPAVVTPSEGPFARLVRDDLKPNRDRSTLRIVAEVRREWSERHLEWAREDVRDALAPALARLVDVDTPLIRHLSAHRWRYCRPDTALGEPFRLDHGLGLGLAGDWCSGGGAAEAFESGDRLGKAMASGDTMHR